MTPLLPGATIGVLGGGQLARMLAVEARRMGYHVGVLDPDERGSGAQVSDFCVVGELDDVDAAKALARRCDVVTLDTEHIPAALLEELEAITPVRPSARVLGIIQDRNRQRTFLAEHDIPQPAFAYVTDDTSLRAAATEVGFPAVLKTTHSGYDGKGQARVESLESYAHAWEQLGRQSVIAEQFIDFEREVSVLLARDLDGNVVHYPLVDNEHQQHVLRRSVAPANVSDDVSTQARRLGEKIARHLNYCGLMAVEFFLTRDHRLLVNEIAPRTHNSGHYTLGACVTSQFEQHVRAICGLPLGPTTLLRPVAMVNVFGDLWQDGEPDWLSLLSGYPSAKLHLYGKGAARRGRKMGHVLVFPESPDGDVARDAKELQARLSAAG